MLPRGWALQGLSGAADVTHEAVHGVSPSTCSCGPSGKCADCARSRRPRISVVRAEAWTT
ncbi:hypothetical protein IQ62_06550 [Streptomyces scabiei]|nr:hypothetical protein IQ62_06550 [Streptomyces scabiei]